jgi:hypothetical protein
MTPSADTEPLLRSPSEHTLVDHEDRFKDHPIRLDAFRRNVRICKGIIGVLLPIHLALEAVHLASHVQAGLPSGTYASLDVYGSALSVILIVSLTRDPS